MTVEGFPAHPLAERAVPQLDMLRPHIGRALSLSAKVRQARSDALVEGLDLAGMGAAVIGRDGKLRSANSAFVAAMGSRMIERNASLVFTDPFLQAEMQATLVRAPSDCSNVASVGVETREGEARMVAHLVPLHGRAKDVAGSDGVLILLARIGNAMLPHADLLRLLFDLTPAEARVARLIAQGHTVTQIASLVHTSVETIRTQVKAVFVKTGVRRQVDLVRLLTSIEVPPSRNPGPPEDGGPS